MSISLQFGEICVEVDNYHQDFLILRTGDAAGLRRIGNAIFQRNFDFVDEVIVTAVEVLLKLNASFSPGDIALLTGAELAANGPAGTASFRSFDLPVHFSDHSEPDASSWEALKKQTGLGGNELIERLTGERYSVAMLGFLPGFVYLDGLPEELHLPRKAVPDKYVGAGSLAIGGKYLGLYAIDSPGGWHVIGKTPLVLLELPDLPPVPYLPGDRFRLLPIDKQEFDRLMAASMTLNEYNARS